MISEMPSGKSRIKERTIQEVIEKVSKWRLYYRGCTINGQYIKLTLEEAAQRVKISKKSLDDYLMQLRSAKKFGFDFESHSQDKVGTIRAFVRKKKEEERRQTAMSKQQASPGSKSNKTEACSTEDAEGTKSRASPAPKTPRKMLKKREFKPRAAKAAKELFK